MGRTPGSAAELWTAPCIYFTRGVKRFWVFRGEDNPYFGTHCDANCIAPLGMILVGATASGSYSLPPMCSVGQENEGR